MKKTAGALVFLAWSSIANALNNIAPFEFPLDKVDFQLTAKQWVSTQTPLLTVTLNATLANADLAKARADIMDKLKKIAPGEWHLTQFDRSQDGSGLEKLDVQAQARVAQSSLTLVYKNAKAVSKPGESYQVSSVEFKPSLDETEQARAQLRERLYQQARDELIRINKIYDGQQYSINNLIFLEGDDITQPKPSYQARGVMNAMVAGGTPAPALTVSNELIMTAIVQAASNRPQGN